MDDLEATGTSRLKDVSTTEVKQVGVRESPLTDGPIETISSEGPDAGSIGVGARQWGTLRRRDYRDLEDGVGDDNGHEVEELSFVAIRFVW